MDENAVYDRFNAGQTQFIAEDGMKKYFIITFSLMVGLIAVNACAEESATKDECVIKMP